MTRMVATLEQKAIVAKYAAEDGTTKAIHYFAKDMPAELKESAVRGWKTTYLHELAIKVKASKGDLSVKMLPAVEKRLTTAIRAGAGLSSMSLFDSPS